MTNQSEQSSIWSADAGRADPNDVEAYDYQLDEDRIAADPADRRDRSRLLVYPADREDIEHTRFDRIGEFLEAGDVLVFNDTRVVPARMNVFKQTGGRVELFVTELAGDAEPDEWRATGGPTVSFRCMTRASNPVRPGMILGDPDRVELPEIEVRDVDSGRAVVEVDWQGSALEFLEEFGEVPLPPYIVDRRKDEGRAAVEGHDRHRYQTVYAQRPGAVAAPTAGLHFTDELLEQLEAGGVELTRVTLTVGPGTFQPVRDDRLTDHDMHSEDYFIPASLGETIDNCRRRNGRTVAVGTTSARALESEARRSTPFEPGWRSTDLFLRPGVPFQLCDGLITNFHLPRSTLLALVAAFTGYDRMRRLYEAAVRNDYRFYSYGDANLLLRR